VWQRAPKGCLVIKGDAVSGTWVTIVSGVMGRTVCARNALGARLGWWMESVIGSVIVVGQGWQRGRSVVLGAPSLVNRGWSVSSTAKRTVV
jgi:hypothetical protein